MIDKEILENYYNQRNVCDELSLSKPDPLYIAKPHNDETIALICALFAYGNSHQIVKFLSSLDFDLLNENEKTIEKNLKNSYYRFQNSQDIAQFFITLKRLKQTNCLYELFLKLDIRWT